MEGEGRGEGKKEEGRKQKEKIQGLYFWSNEFMIC